MSISIGTTEALVVTPLAIVANTIANGEVYRINLQGYFGGPQYSLSVRFGPNGNSSDPIIYQSNNIQSNTFLLNDLNSFAANNPGVSPIIYQRPGTKGTPSQCVGQLLVYVANVGSNATMTVQSATQGDEQDNLLKSVGTGIIANVNVTGLNVTNYFSVTSNVYSPWFYNFIGVGGGQIGTPYGNSFVQTQLYPAVNSTFTLGVIEQISPSVVGNNSIAAIAYQQTVFNTPISNTLSATQNNWSPLGMTQNTNLIILNTSNSNTFITGMNTASFTLGLPVLLYNNSNSNTIVFLNQSNASALANQFTCPGSANAVLTPQNSMKLILIATTPSPTLIFN